MDFAQKNVLQPNCVWRVGVSRLIDAKENRQTSRANCTFLTHLTRSSIAQSIYRSAQNRLLSETWELGVVKIAAAAAEAAATAVMIFVCTDAI